MADVEARRLPDRDNEVCEGAQAYTVTKAVSLETLTNRLAAQTGRRPGLVAEGDLAAASGDAPVTVWVVSDEIDHHAVRKAVREYAEPDAPLQTPPPGGLAFLAKADSEEPLTDDEMQQAVKYLLRGTRGSA